MEIAIHHKGHLHHIKISPMWESSPWLAVVILPDGEFETERTLGYIKPDGQVFEVRPLDPDGNPPTLMASNQKAAAQYLLERYQAVMVPRLEAEVSRVMISLGIE